MLEKFGRRYPEVRPRIVSGTYPTALPMLRDGSIDFTIGPEMELQGSEDILAERLFNNTPAIVCRRGYPRAGTRSLADLLDQEWLFFSEAKSVEAEFAPLVADQNLPMPARVICCESATATLSLIANSDMTALVPRQYLDFIGLRDIITEISIANVPGRAISLLTRCDRTLMPAVRLLHEAFRTAALDYACGQR